MQQMQQNRFSASALSTQKSLFGLYFVYIYKK